MLDWFHVWRMLVSKWNERDKLNLCITKFFTYNSIYSVFTQNPCFVLIPIFENAQSEHNLLVIFD